MAAVLIGAAAVADERCDLVGINHDFVWSDPADVPALIQAVRDTGASWVRVPLRWRTVEPASGEWTWTATDPVVNQLDATGIQILALLMSVPSWANGKRDGEVEGWFDCYAPNDIADWERYVRQVVRRYKSTIRHWELWNEQNGIDFYRPLPDAAAYVRLLQAGYRAVKAEQPDGVVVMGGLQMNGIIANPWSPVKVENFLAQQYQAGAKGYYDVVNIHPYITEHDPIDGLTAMVAGTLEVMRAHGEDGMPLWITEVGVPSRADPSGALQAQNLRETFAALAGMPQVEKVFWFCLRDFDRDLVGPEASLGVYTLDLQPKPAVAALREVVEQCKRGTLAREPR